MLVLLDLALVVVVVVVVVVVEEDADDVDIAEIERALDTPLLWCPLSNTALSVVPPSSAKGGN